MNLTLDSVTYSHEGHEDSVIENINLHLSEGEISILKGYSGIGKTTLSKIMCGAIPKLLGGSLQGKVMIDGEDINKYSLVELSQWMGVVFQDPDTQLFMPTVEDEIAFGLENKCVDKEEINSTVQLILEEFNMTHLKVSNPKRCSGGEKQLIVFMSVVVMDRPILILDEAFSQVDEKRRKLVENKILELKSQEKCIFMIDHYNHFMDFAEHKYSLKDGKIIELL